MPEPDHPTLSTLIEGVLAELEGEETGEVEAVGLEISAETAFAERVAALGAKAKDRDKPEFQKMARALRKAREAAVKLKGSGRLEVDLRERESGAEALGAVRFFYAHEAEIEWPQRSGGPRLRLRGWAFTSQRSSTPFSPLALRSAFERLQGTVFATFADPSAESLAYAVNRGALEAGLEVLRALHPRLDGFVVWHYDETHRRYKSLASIGTGTTLFNVPVSRSHQEKRTGIVSQILPDRRAVVYDSEDESLWRVSGEGEWQPFDRVLFKRRGWRSCIAIPIVSAGRLAGALSAYSAEPASVFEHCETELSKAASLFSEAILARRDHEVIADLVARYDEELLTANVSLAALSLSHDVLHLNRTVTKQLKDGRDYLKANQLGDAKKEFKAAAALMARTEPTIEAMRRLATEARTSESKEGPQETPDAGAVLIDFSKLLKSILPHFSKEKELQPEGVMVSVKGEPRVVKIDSLTLERIVMNLCVNAAQWRASNIWVTGHFDRSTEEFQLVVRDDGRGISAAARDRVFDRFFTKRRGGSGLGLYVVKSLTTRAGGEVFLQSYDYNDKADYTGTVVTVVLPTKAQPERA